MKSRLAVSLLFILIASTFASDAIADFKELSLWACDVYRGHVVEVLRNNTVSANRTREISAISAGQDFTLTSDLVMKFLTRLGAHTQSVALKVMGSNYHCAACDFMRTAGKRVQQALGLTRIQ